MKLFLTVLGFLFCVFTINAQESIGAIQNLELNVLYRGYSNKIKVATTECDNVTVKLVGRNCRVSPLNRPGEFVVKPGNGRLATLSIVRLEADSSETVIHETQYRVHNLPDPTLYWGGSRSGVKPSRHSRLILAKYPPEVPLSAYFSVKEWTMTIDSSHVTGVGGSLKAADSLIGSIKGSIKANRTVQIEVKCVGPDGIVRSLTGQWPIGEPCKEEEKPVKSNGCG
ncbi:MAG: hypothetical protein ACFHU9_03565 [Fluviicola sp.]